MVRRNRKTRRSSRRVNRGSIIRGFGNNRITTGTGLIGYLRLLRIAIGILPGDHSDLAKTVFDFVFNLIKIVAGTTEKQTWYTGAYTSFGITPAALLLNSPLLARNGTSYSFPGYPVSVKWLRLRLRDTTQNSERSGRWAAVMIPYREDHDVNHYATVIANLSYEEVAAMPYAKSTDCRNDIVLNFKMRDRTNYCARPREITEEIALVFVIWDTFNKSSVVPDNTSFNCEIDVQGGCVPHVIFGPQHRINYPAAKFNFRSLTGGDTRVHYPDGRIELEPTGFEIMQS